MALRKTLPRSRWTKGMFWFEHKRYKDKLLDFLSDFPVLADGEYLLTDEDGNYLIDESGNYLVGSDA